jgi:hypothetical protein
VRMIAGSPFMAMVLARLADGTPGCVQTHPPSVQTAFSTGNRLLFI